MKCQHCGNLDTTVLETRELMAGTVVRRRRGCGICGGSFATYEIDGGIWGTVKKWALKSRAPALEKKHALRARDAEIASLILAGHQLKDIAVRFGLSASTISYAAKKAGLPARRVSKRAKPATNPWIGLL